MQQIEQPVGRLAQSSAEVGESLDAVSARTDISEELRHGAEVTAASFGNVSVVQTLLGHLLFDDVPDSPVADHGRASPWHLASSLSVRSLGPRTSHYTAVPALCKEEAWSRKSPEKWGFLS